MNRTDSTAPRPTVRVGGLVLLVAVAAVLVLFGLGLLSMDTADRPGGIIGYRLEGREVWVRADGHTVAEPEGVDDEEVTDGGGEIWSPDGRLAAFMEVTVDGAWVSVREGDSVRRVGRLADARSPRIVGGPKGVALDSGGVPLVIAWSSDSQTLAWGNVTEPPYNLHIAKRGEWDVRSLPLVGGWAGELAWSPDGRFLAISTYAENRTDHTLLMFDTLGSEAPRQLAKGCVMVWSPDSRHLVLHGEPKSQPGLWVVSVDGHARQITERTAVAPFVWLAD